MIITLDFETHWSADYSLSKMTTEEYVRDPRFKVHGVALKVDDHPAQWTDAGWLRTEAARVAIGQNPLLAHHAQFDGLILSHHFGIRSALWLDTLSMARIALPHERHSLDALSKYFGLPGKQHQKLADVKGVRDPSPDQLRALGEMACDDADKTYKVFQQIREYIPREEFTVIDMTVRMFTEPKLRLDRPKLAAYHAKVVAEKQDILTELGVDRGTLQSADKFADTLRSLGVDPPTKPSPTGNGDIYAFAKTDQGMRDLVDSDDERVANLAAARLGIKSTLNETRCERLLSMDTRGPLAVYLRYAGAHTTRWSGGDSLNWQNFPRGGDIRQSIVAPEGYKLVVGDLAQIECRMLNWLAGEQRVLGDFASGADIYSGVASRFYGRDITRADKVERHLGKTIELGCGYGMGGPKFRDTCRRGPLGGAPILLSDDEALKAVQLYRQDHPHVTYMWKLADHVLAELAARSCATDWGPMTVDNGAIWLPNGVPLWYDEQTTRDGDRYVKLRGQWRKMYGAKLVENVVQALSRVVLSQAMLRIARRYPVVNCTHDEVMVLARVDDDQALEYTLSELKRTPQWAAGLPLDAEGFESDRYGK